MLPAKAWIWRVGTVLLVAGCATAGGAGEPEAPDAAVVEPGASDAGVPPVDAAPPAIDAAPPDAAITELGRIGYWGGKVNVHRPYGGEWTWDEDCTSGAGIDTLTYCRKFFPATQTVTQVPVTPKPVPVWNDANCTAVYPGNGQQEYVCEL